MQDLSLYIHIPFCQQKCYYCAFNSFCATQKQQEDYISLLCQEIITRKSLRPVKTIYIGGGTPSLLTCQQLYRVVHTIFDNFDIYENAEFTIEANPNSITQEKLKCWKDLKINRLSIGVQSLSDKSLRKIGRLHNKKTALEQINLARKYFDNISADLLVGLEAETGKDLINYAKQLINIGVKQISCYLLEVYANTKLSLLIDQKKYFPQTDEQQVMAFNKLANFLQEKNFRRYEISNFALQGYESQHNLNYWRRGEYLGFGISAHSFEGNRRYKNADNLKDYPKKIEEEFLTNKEIAEELIMLGLRCENGVDLQKLMTLGCNLKENEFFNQYLKEGIITEQNNKIYLNPLFYHISNTIISNLL